MVEIEKVIDSIKRGEDSGLQHLYKHYSDALYGIVLRILVREDESEDALQESFLKIWNHIDSYQPAKATLFTWMATIARNTALDKKRLKSYEMTSQTQSIIVGENDPRIESSSPSIDIPNLTQKIPEKYRVLVDKMFIHGYTQKEISEEMDIPLGTVKTRLREAISMLRNELKNERHLLYMLSLI
jgi:RNA polymerase sigma factor (sigma-70 family)